MPSSDLLHAHLSGAATPDETDALDAALATDPALARAFVEAARVEAQLAAHFARNRPVLPLLTELQNGSQFSPAPNAASKGGQSFQAVPDPLGSAHEHLAGQAGSADLPSRSPAASAQLRLPPSFARPAPPSYTPRTRRPSIRAAAAILLALGLLAATLGWLVRNDELSSADSPSAAAPKRKSSPRTVETPTLPKPPTFGTHQETPEMQALRRRLERYHLTGIGLDQAMPLSRALQRLLARARELNHLRRPIIDALSTSPDRDPDAVAAADVSVRLPHQTLTLMDALRLVAIQAECDIRLEPPGVIVLQPLPGLDSQKIVTRTLRVRPDFVSSRIDTTRTTTNTHPSQKDPAAQATAQTALQIRSEMHEFQAQLDSIIGKSGRDLVAAAANLGLLDSNSSAIYGSYLAAQTNLKAMEQRGAGPSHPDILVIKARMENAERQLEEGAKHLRSNLQVKLSTAASILAEVEKFMEETTQRDGSPSMIAEEEKAHPTSAAANLVAREAIEDFGIGFPENTDAVFNSATSTLAVTHTEAALRQIEAFLAVPSNQAAMINVTTKLFEFANRHELENRLMDSAEFAFWLKEQNALGGAALLTAPQVTTRPGQNARVEVIREVAGLPDPDWQGTRIDVHPTLEGEVVHLTGSAEVRRPRDGTPGRLLGDGITPTSDLVSTAVDIQAVVPPGQTALFSLSEYADGPHLVAAITIHLIDPSGQAVGGGSDGQPK